MHDFILSLCLEQYEKKISSDFIARASGIINYMRSLLMKNWRFDWMSFSLKINLTVSRLISAQIVAIRRLEPCQIDYNLASLMQLIEFSYLNHRIFQCCSSLVLRFCGDESNWKQFAAAWSSILFTLSKHFSPLQWK